MQFDWSVGGVLFRHNSGDIMMISLTIMSIICITQQYSSSMFCVLIVIFRFFAFSTPSTVTGAGAGSEKLQIGPLHASKTINSPELRKTGWYSKSIDTLRGPSGAGKYN